MNTIKIGTRGSDLALYQAKAAQHILERSGKKCKIIIIKTRGDKDYRAFTELSGDSFFTKEIENSLLERRIDIAIHSGKDLASLENIYLPWVSFAERAPSTDCLIYNKNLALSPFTKFVVGTSSPRRKAQIKKDYPNCTTIEFRGNVPSRLEKIANKEVDATILAKAGLQRLGLYDKLPANLSKVDLDWSTAPCQGIMIAQSHIENKEILQILNNQELTLTAKIEKNFLAYKGGGCHMAIGANWSKDKIAVFFHNKQQETKKNLIADVNEFERLNNAYLEMSFLKIKKPKASVFLTHSIRNQEKVAQLLVKNQIKPYILDLIEIKSAVSPTVVKKAINYAITGKTSLVFTSQYAAQFFMMEFLNLGYSINQLQKTSIYAVGKTTKNILSSMGLNKVLLPEKQNSQALYSRLKNDGVVKLVHPSNENSKLLSLLATSDIEYLNPVVYTTTEKENIKLPNQYPENSHFFFASPISVDIAVNKIGRDTLSKHPIFAMGMSTYNALKKHQLKAHNNDISGSWEQLVQQLKDL